MAAVGAEIAVESAVDWLRRHLENQQGPDLLACLEDAALHAREDVLARAAEDGEEASCYAATLLLVVGTPAGGAALQIGDGVIVLGGSGGVDGLADWQWVFWPERGEYANTTSFLTDDHAPDHLRVALLPGSPLDVAVMTDGLQPLALHYASQTVHEPFFEGMFLPLHGAVGPPGSPLASAEIPALSASLEEFLTSERVRMRTDDDLSLILATRRSPVPPD